jgi:hypothetical protein
MRREGVDAQVSVALQDCTVFSASKHSAAHHMSMSPCASGNGAKHSLILLMKRRRTAVTPLNPVALECAELLLGRCQGCSPIAVAAARPAAVPAAEITAAPAATAVCGDSPLAAAATRMALACALAASRAAQAASA